MSDSEEPPPAEADLDKEVLLQLYSIHSNLISNNESKRQLANQIYTAIVSALIAAGAVVMTDDSRSNNVSVDFFAITTILLCCVWYLTIQYHRRLASAKFSVVLRMEKKFQIHPYAEEWAFFKSASAAPRSPELTTIERSVPLIVGVMATVLLVSRNYEYLLSALSGS